MIKLNTWRVDSDPFNEAIVLVIFGQTVQKVFMTHLVQLTVHLHSFFVQIIDGFRKVLIRVLYSIKMSQIKKNWFN